MAQRKRVMGMPAMPQMTGGMFGGAQMKQPGQGGGQQAPAQPAPQAPPPPAAPQGGPQAPPQAPVLLPPIMDSAEFTKPDAMQLSGDSGGNVQGLPPDLQAMLDELGYHGGHKMPKGI